MCRIHIHTKTDESHMWTKHPKNEHERFMWLDMYITKMNSIDFFCQFWECMKQNSFTLERACGLVSPKQIYAFVWIDFELKFSFFILAFV